MQIHYYTKQEYRQNYMTKSIANVLKPCITIFIPYHTKWAVERGYDCFNIFLYKT